MEMAKQWSMTACAEPVVPAAVGLGMSSDTPSEPKRSSMEHRILYLAESRSKGAAA